MVSSFIERSPEDLSKKLHDYICKNGCFWLLLQIGLGYITRHYLRLRFMQSAQNLFDVPVIYILIPSRFMTRVCVCVLRYSSAHQTHSFDYVLTFLIGPFQLSDGAQLRFHCSFCLTGSVAFDHPNQSHTFIYSVMVMTNVFVVWGIQLITLIVFDGFIKVADFLSRMRNFFWLM